MGSFLLKAVVVLGLGVIGMLVGCTSSEKKIDPAAKQREIDELKKAREKEWEKN